MYSGKTSIGAALDLGDVDLALADLELAIDGVAVLLERLGVDLGDDLVRVVVLRTDDDRLGRAAVASSDPPSSGSPEAHPARATVAPTATAANAASRPFPAVIILDSLHVMGRPTAARGRVGPERSSADLDDPHAGGHDEALGERETSVDDEREDDHEDGSAEHLGVVAGLEALRR